jgi:hypothetical protein
VVWLERAKIGEEPLGDLKVSVAFSIFNPSKHKSISFPKFYPKCCLIIAETWRAVGTPVLRLSWKLFLVDFSSLTANKNIGGH